MLTTIDRWFPRIVLATGVLLCCLECRAEAEPARVDAGQVCAVNHALRGKWSPKMCEWTADAFNETGDPALMLAVCTNESDLRERAHRVTLLPDGLVAHDIGLCAVRCIVDPEAGPLDRDICTNGMVKGMSAHVLYDAPTNIRAAWTIMSTKKRPGNYNAGTAAKARSYEARVFVLMAAWAGELRIPKRATGAKWARVKGLAKRIVEAVKGESRS